MDAPDLVRYPDAGKLRPVSVVMRPGDALLFPAHCGHRTKTLSASVSLSFRPRQLSTTGTLTLTGLHSAPELPQGQTLSDRGPAAG